MSDMLYSKMEKEQTSIKPNMHKDAEWIYTLMHVIQCFYLYDFFFFTLIYTKISFP